uniref:Reverse transcriptase domain-containing protein n=1 Tax=Cannabis sativa TaxID=3483 RepID=A0A803QNG9_CANSA
MDMALVSNEVVDEFKHLKKKGVVLKVDIEKAYDLVEWKFLENEALDDGMFETEFFFGRIFGLAWRL